MFLAAKSRVVSCENKIQWNIVGHANDSKEAAVEPTNVIMSFRCGVAAARPPEITQTHVINELCREYYPQICEHFAFKW